MVFVRSQAGAVEPHQDSLVRHQRSTTTPSRNDRIVPQRPLDVGFILSIAGRHRDRMSTDLSTCHGQTDTEIGSGGKPASGHFRRQRRQTHKNGKPRWRNGLGQLEHGQIVDPIHEHDSRPDTLLVIGWKQDVESFAECAFVRHDHMPIRQHVPARDNGSRPASDHLQFRCGKFAVDRLGRDPIGQE